MFEAPKSWSTRTMLAARMEGVRGKVIVEEMHIPEIGPDDALVRVTASGICRSDCPAIARTLA